MATDGGTAEKTFDAPSGVGTSHAFLRWTPDGRALSHVVMSAGVDNVWMQQVSGGSPTPVTDFSEDLIWYHSWAADGPPALERGRVNQDIVLVTREGKW